MPSKNLKKLAKKAAIDLTMMHRDADEKFGGVQGIRPADSYEKEEKELAEVIEEIFLKNKSQKRS